MYFAFFVVFLFWTGQAAAQQHVEAVAHVAVAQSSEFDFTDSGIGARLSWFPRDSIGADAELTFYPRNRPGPVAFTSGRTEAFFGGTVGPRLGAVRPFAKVRPGFLRFNAAPDPIACILIFPPPLSCILAAGRTMFALDLGGGIDVAAGGRLAVRIDAGDRLVKYPGPSFHKGVRQDSFYSHDFRMSFGAGVRF